jgi:zinc protease
LNYLFGGQFTARLNQNLRQDKGYSYGYRSSVQWYGQSSLLLAGGGVQTAVTREAVVETLKEFADIRGDRPVGEEEFLAAKSSLLRQYPSSFETCGQVLQQLTQMALFNLPDDYCQTVSSNVEAVSMADVQRVARERVEAQPMVLVVGDRASVEPGLSTLGLSMGLVDHNAQPI